MSTTPAAHVESSNDDADQVVRACEKLRVPLTRLAGTTGFSSLLSRALALAMRQAPSLERLRVEADGSQVIDAEEWAFERVKFRE